MNILPCPCCGSPALISESSKGFRVQCKNWQSCDIGNLYDNWTRDGAIEIWNRRVDPFKAGVREGWRECQEMEDRNQAFFYILGCVEEEEMSPRTLKMATAMKAEIEERKRLKNE